jgi:hypothetical protein
MPSTLGIVASGEDVFNDAVLWLDTARSVAAETTMVNYGKGGSALNATYGSSAGADTNDPLLLTHSGTNYLYLPGLAGSSVSCTAPGTAVSYAATPVGGGGDTTGAATGGAAFTFSTAGSWSSVRLLNAGGSTVAQFTVNAGNQTALTDSFGVVWALNRSTSGRKSVAVVRNVLLFGTDDYLQIADNDLLDFGASDSFTVMVSWREHATVPSFARYVSKSQTASPGWEFLHNSTIPGRSYITITDGAATTDTSGRAGTYAQGSANTVVAVRNTAADTLLHYNNGVAAGSAATDTTTGTLANSAPVRIGRASGAGANYADMELISVAIWRRALSTNEIATAVARYA